MMILLHVPGRDASRPGRRPVRDKGLETACCRQLDARVFAKLL